MELWVYGSGELGRISFPASFFFREIGIAIFSSTEIWEIMLILGFSRKTWG
jgi:hypothetical protein